MVKRLLSKDPDERMPPQGEPLDEKTNRDDPSLGSTRA